MSLETPKDFWEAHKLEDIIRLLHVAVVTAIDDIILQGCLIGFRRASQVYTYCLCFTIPNYSAI